jgi:BMFP domain-containing protein YqiC
MDTKPIDDISRRIADLIASTPIIDVQKNLRALLLGWMERMDLVTREEFDAQREVLARTREKLQRMEARVKELEEKGREA